MENRIYIATFSENAIEVIRENNVNIELNHTCISENLDKDKICHTIDDIRQDIEKSGAENYIVHGPFTEICPGSIDHRAVDLGLARLEEAYQVCKKIDADRMVAHTGYMPLIYYKEWHKMKSLEFWHRFMADKPGNFRLYIENVFEDEPYMLKELIEEIGDHRISICLDIGHANVMTDEKNSVDEWIKILGRYIGHFHLHNNYGDKDIHNPLTEGDMDMESILAAIARYCKPEVTLTVESKSCAESAAWLKNRM